MGEKKINLLGTRPLLTGIIQENRMTEEEELDVVRRVRDGEIDAYAVLVSAYQDALIRMLATLLHDQRRLAEDVAQEVLVEAFRRLPSFDPARSRFSTWLFMIARSRGINAGKRKRPLLVAEVPDRTVDTSDRLHHREDLAILDRALHELPPDQKRAFTLAVIEDLPYATVARIEGTREGTIKSRVSRARASLKSALEARS